MLDYVEQCKVIISLGIKGEVAFGEVRVEGIEDFCFILWALRALIGYLEGMYDMSLWEGGHSYVAVEN